MTPIELHKSLRFWVQTSSQPWRLQMVNLPFFLLSPSQQVDGKMVDGGMPGDANGVEPAPGRVKNSGKWQKPRFSRKALMKCCLVKWIIASTQPQDKGEPRRKQTWIGVRSDEWGLIFYLNGWTSPEPPTPRGPDWLMVWISWPQGQAPEIVESHTRSSDSFTSGFLWFSQFSHSSSSAPVFNLL